MDSLPGPRQWIRVMGLPLHLRGEAVHRVLGDQCGGFLEADESSADLGSFRLCVRGLEKMPQTVLLRWRSWSFSLPIWVEVRPLVVPVTLPGGEEGGLDFGLERRDLRRTNRGCAKIVGVNEYKQRFGRSGRPTDLHDKEVWVCPTTQASSVVGSLGVLPGPQLCLSEAHNSVDVSLGQQRWAQVNHPPDMGLAGGEVTFKAFGSGLGPVVLDPVLSNPGQNKPTLTRVCASLRNGLGLRRVDTAFDASPESGRPQVAATVAIFGDSRSLVVVSPNIPELSRPLTAMTASSESRLPQEKNAIENFGGSSHSIGSSIAVSPNNFSVLVGVEPCLQELSCGTNCEPDRNGDAGSWSTQVDRLALVVQAEVVDAAVDVANVVVEEGFASPVLDFHEDVIPSSAEVSRWVLSRINEVSHFLGLSFEGHEHEAFALFSAIEGTWRESAPNCQDGGISRNPPGKGVSQVLLSLKLLLLPFVSDVDKPEMTERQ
ncbi:hypothetical protein LOK49_LG07G00759 [Camellia lanceoleosa]|uniref:Uncharacterized protein n=1 Tax=Camellia lanceoleosa TaxID=1840588 RepID=A0ACC0H4P6_9ERIC|nr:hypothetical protein LOK49_LG07G00759 [Camellia lanceoleosa]